MVDELLKARVYARPIVRRILGSRGCEASVEDVLQDALVNAYVHREQFSGRSKISSWYVRIAINSALTFLRANRCEFVAFDAVDKPLVSRRSSPETLAYLKEIKSAVLKVLLELSPLHRDALLRSISGETSTTPRQKGRLYKARQTIRRQFRGKLPVL